jgi:hypothetical protein
VATAGYPSTTGRATGRATDPATDPAVSSASGALAELLGRWQEPAGSQSAPVTAPPGPPPSAPSSPLVPAAAAAAAAAGSRSAELDPTEVLDVVERVLGEVLRREAEQHGLDGGAW